jgi:hypothetical protein
MVESWSKRAKYSYYPHNEAENLEIIAILNKVLLISATNSCDMDKEHGKCADDCGIEFSSSYRCVMHYYYYTESKHNVWGYNRAILFLWNVNTVAWPPPVWGSLETDTVKYGLESHETRTREWLRWRGSAAIVNDRFILSWERMLHKGYDCKCSVE